MSLSPAELDSDEMQHDSRFMQNQNRLYQFIREGKSFSGHEQNCCFLNLANGRFANISATSGMDFADDARGLALTDWDHDGDLDLWITNRTGPRLRFLQNNAGRAETVVQLRLVGKSCNRDAVGSRVTMKSSASQQIRTLRAGDGYLAQSTKWLHFAVPDEGEITKITVDWPGGERQDLGSLTTGARYIVEQGQPPREVSRRPSIQITSASVIASSEAGSHQAKLKSPIPAPAIRFESMTGETQELQTTEGQHQVVTLWASWCAPCLDELREHAEKQDDLKKAKLKIVAVCVDDAADQPTGRAAALALQDRLQLPFEIGFATAETLDRLQHIYNQCFGLHIPLPIPTSLVFDDHHRLVAVVKGKATVEQLVKMVQPEPASAQIGKWVIDPNYDLAFMVSMLLEEGSVDDAIDFLHDFDRDFYRGDRYATVVAQLGTRLVGLNRIAEAEPYFQIAVQMKPENAEWQNDLASTRHMQGKTAEAIDHFRAAAKLAPGNIEIQRNLVTVLISLGKSNEAIASLQVAIHEQPDNVVLRVMLADVLRQSGKITEAIEAYRQALKLDPNHVAAVQNLGATLLATRNFPDAIPLLRQATLLKPDDAGAFKNLGLAYAVTGKRKAAIENLQTSIRLAPDDASVHNNLGSLLAQSGDLEAAEKEFQRAVELAPDNAKYRGNLDNARKQTES